MQRKRKALPATGGITKRARPAADVNSLPVSSVPKSVRMRMARTGCPPEVKQFGATDLLAFTTTSTVYGLCQRVVQGDTNSSRDGHQIFLRDIQFVLDTYPAQLPANSGMCALAIVLDTQASNGAAIGWGDVFESASPTAFPRFDQRGRFKILKLIRFPQDYVSITRTSDVPSNRYYNFKINVNQFIQYNANTGNVTDLVKNQISLISIGSLAPGVGYGGTMKWRMTFFD